MSKSKPSMLRRVLWHIVGCIIPTLGYVLWLEDRHPRWKR